MNKAVLGIGTNIGDRTANIDKALEALSHLPQTSVRLVSGYYETRPVGFLEQPDFINAAAELETALSPNALLGACLGIEAVMGRERPFKNAPRIIDIDLLVYEGRRMDTAELMLPHPRMRERAFVLVPLRDLFPNMNIYGFDFSEDYDNINKHGVKEALAWTEKR